MIQISSSSDSQYNTLDKLQYKTHVDAAKGLLTCRVYGKIINRPIVYTVAITVLTSTSVMMSKLPLWGRITLGIISLGSLIFNIYVIRKRYIANQIGKRWEPIFQSILQGTYWFAYQNIQQITENFSKNQPFDRYCRDLSFSFSISDIKTSGSNLEFFQSLAMRIAFLNALYLGSKKNKTDLKLELDSYGSNIRNGPKRIEKLTKLYNESTPFSSRITSNMSVLLFNEVVSKIKVISDERTNEKPILRFLYRLKVFGEDIKKVDRESLEAFLRCRNLKELLTQANRTKDN